MKIGRILRVAICLILCLSTVLLTACSAIGGMQGADGKDGKTPEIRINDEGIWEVSYDNGETWTSLGVSAVGASAIAPKLQINDEGIWEVSYDDGETWTSLGVSAVGTDGAAGKDAATPKFQISGSGIWEVSYDDGESWISLGVSALGTSEEVIIPKIQINDEGIWEISYDDGKSWASLGTSALGTPGADGAAGSDGSRIEIGENGNWFIDGVDTGVKAVCCDGNGCSCCNRGGDEDEEESADTFGTPILRFAVASDLHLRTTKNDYNSLNQLKALFSTAYGYAESQADYSTLDGIFFVGDITQNGSNAELKLFFNTVKSLSRGDTVVRSVMGNHEFFSTNQGDGKYAESSIVVATENFLNYSGYESVNMHLEIGGFHFILLSNDVYDNTNHNYFKDETLAWLKSEIDSAVATDPTGTKPIFVFQHESPDNNEVRGFKSGDEDLAAVLKNYPQVVDFSGHTHRALIDPQSIWQDGFTAIGTGGLAYIGINMAGSASYDKTMIAVDAYGSWTTLDIEELERNAGMYQIIEINDKNQIRIRHYDIFTESLYGDPLIFEVGDPEKFVFTYDREDASVAPQFDAGAEITVVHDEYNYSVVTYPVAKGSGRDFVQYYVVEAWNGATLVKTEYRIAGYMYGDAQPATAIAPITGLAPDTTYTIKVYPVNCWGKVGEALIGSFTTAPKTLNADILDVQFNTNGTAVNLVDGEAIGKYGTVSVAYDEEIGMNSATFTGNNGYKFEGIDEWYDAISHGVTVEGYFKVTGSTGTTMAIGLNTESAGFGISVTSAGKIRFGVHCQTSSKAEYYYASTDVNAVVTGEWIHVVGVFTGSKAFLYVNGVEVASVDTPAKGMFTTPQEASRLFCIGCDTDSTGNPEFGLKGDIAAIRLYSRAMTASEAAELYTECTDGAK